MNLAYLYGEPQQPGQLKANFTDFIVREELGYPLTDEGEFITVKVRKTNANTLFVGEKLAEFLGFSAKQMSYAGLKDRHAVTEQWFCFHQPGQNLPDFTDFALEGVEILAVTRHQRKIRVGALAGNHFELLLRGVVQTDDLEQRLVHIQQYGFPNYFTEQRFGRDGHNLTQALRWAAGEIQVKDRKKRSFYLSSARSEVFNLVVSERIQAQLINQVLAQDILQLAGSNSWFVANEAELDDLQRRLDSGDLLLTAPLIGDRTEQSPPREQALLAQHHALLALMRQERMAPARRAMLARAHQFNWQYEAEGLRLRFFLEAGSYATALVRELIKVEENEQAN